MLRISPSTAGWLWIALCVPVPALAQDKALVLDGVVVTATRTAVTEDETLASVSVITREDIERSQASSVTELLRGRAGIAISSNGGEGKATAVFLRGTESDHTLVLVDGIKVGSATSGAAALQDIPLAQIERIEIVRGPRSSLYGSEAIGGVIQIFTRRAKEGLRAGFSIGGGTHETRNAEGHVLGGNGRAWYALNLNWRETEGINACTGRPFPDGAGCFTVEPDRDGYLQRGFGLRGGWDFNEQHSAEGQFTRVSGFNAFDGSFVNEGTFEQRVAASSYRFDGARVDLKVGLGHSADFTDNFLDGEFRSRFDTRRNVFDVQADIDLGALGLGSVGLDWQRDRVKSSTPFDQTERDNQGVFAQLQSNAGPVDLQAAVRHDDNEQFGGHLTGSLAAGMDLAESVRVFASYGTAYKAPSFNELYFPGFGNASLEPEESRSAEIGVQASPGDATLEAALFSTRVEDLIAFDADLGLPNNIDNARINGVELGWRQSLAGFDFDGSLSHVETENRAPFFRGNWLPRRPRNSARLDIDRSLERVDLGLTWLAEGPRYDDLANARALGGYATLDLRARFRLGDAWAIKAQVKNLLDREYETASFFNSIGRSLELRLDWQLP